MEKLPCLCDGRKDIRCVAEHCDIAGPGSPGNPNECRICWRRLGLHSPLAEWVSTQQLVSDSILLAGKIPPNVSGIVGIPRSGMLPASIIATHLQLPLLELPYSSASGPRPLGWGSRGYSLRWAGDRQGPLVVVDDTICAGTAMMRAKEQMQGQKALFAAVYPVIRKVSDLDLYARPIADIQLLEWNVFNSGLWYGHANHNMYGAGIACDFDGILCHDPTVKDDDSESGVAAYTGWLENATPLHLPRRLPCRLIVTARLERFRPQTEAWLRRWGVRWERLVMHKGASFWERNNSDVAAWKAHVFAASDCGVFIESDPHQAARIFDLSRKFVACPARGKVWTPTWNEIHARNAAASNREPGAVRRAINFVKSATKHIANGAKAASPEEKERRLSICRLCEAFNAKRSTCTKCGCFLSMKAGWQEQECPLAKW